MTNSKKNFCFSLSQKKANSLRVLIRSGKLTRPRCSIQVLLGAEMCGSLPHVETNLEPLRDKKVAAACFDTTAEK